MATETTTPIIIRHAKADDAPQILGLIRNVYHEYGFVFEPETETPDLLDFSQAYLRESSMFLVGVVAEKIVGSIGVKFVDATTTEIYRLYLESAWRGLGLGRRLLEEGLSWSKTQQAKKVILWSDTRFTLSHKLYLRSGFVQSDFRKVIDDPNDTVEYQFTLEL